MSDNADKVSPEAVTILQRLGQIRQQILELVQPLRYQLPYQEVYRLQRKKASSPSSNFSS